VNRTNQRILVTSQNIQEPNVFLL